MNAELSKYNPQLQAMITQEGAERTNRTIQLVKATEESIRHFLKTREYGDPKKCGPDTLPAYWPYVRYLVADILSPKFGYGPSKFADIAWSSKLLKDFSNEAQKIIRILPEDIQDREWRFVVRVATHMLMHDQSLQGYISQAGRDELRQQTLQAGAVPGDIYEIQFKKWETQFAK